MEQQVLVAFGMTVAVFGATFSLLAMVFRAQVRRYNRAVATQVLDDWAGQLELLHPAERERVSPPADVLAAMVALPAHGLSTGWSGTPKQLN
jgi:hypothetical protein